MASARRSEEDLYVNRQPTRHGNAEFDLDERDPLAINPHLMVRFDDLFAEPDGIRSADCIWTCTYKTFRGTKWCCYNFITAICFVPCAIIWGCCFAYVPFTHIWCFTPCSKCLNMNCHCVKVAVSLLIEAVCAPMYYTCGLVFSRFRISIFHENKPLKLMETEMHEV